MVSMVSFDIVFIEKSQYHMMEAGEKFTEEVVRLKNFSIEKALTILQEGNLLPFLENNKFADTATITHAYIINFKMEDGEIVESSTERDQLPGPASRGVITANEAAKKLQAKAKAILLE